MTTPDRISRGLQAVEVGTPDFGKNGERENADGYLTDAGDTIANILHWLYSVGSANAQVSTAHRLAFALAALDRAEMHFRAEIRGE
jgi:hypothetical protein